MAVPLSDLTVMPDPQQVYAADGTRRATYTWGDVDGPVVVIVHGFASSKNVNWAYPAWVSTLAKAGRRVIALDNRGHGESSKLYDPEDYHIGTMATDVRALMDHLKIERTDIMGYSMGSRISAYIAHREPIE